MEANKTTCNTCGKVEFWHGWKTKTLKAQNRDKCRKCLSPDIRIEPDTETELGKMYEEQDAFAANLIANILQGLITEKMEKGEL